MSLEELYYISQIVAVIAIIGSLIAVYFQVRQTNIIARANFTHSAYLQAAQMQLSAYDTQEKADLMTRALTGAEPLNDAERARVDVSLTAVFVGFGAAFNLRQRDLMDVGTYNGLEAMARVYLRSRYARAYWARHRTEGHDAKYVALLDGIVRSIEAERSAAAKSEELHP